ncbi:MAG: hypothetical protein U0586_05890 [Candidatus Brocadiaceae bacterium]
MDDKNEENNKDEDMSGIIEKIIEKGILIDFCEKSPTMSDILDIPCEVFVKHLKTLWPESYNLDISMKARMIRHLRKIKWERKCP